MTDRIPDYLAEPTYAGHLYGELQYNVDRKRFVIAGEPAMREFAKRLFPGARVTRDLVAFDDTRRAAGDLNWFLLRFPLRIGCPEELAAARQRAVDHALRRTANADLTATVPPAEFTGKLFPYQQVGVSYLCSNERTLLADGMGLGKTWTALGAAAQVGKYPVLIVCQTHVQRQWQRAVGALLDMPGTGQEIIGETQWDRAERKGKALAPILRTLTPYDLPSTPFAIIHYGLLSAWREDLERRGYPVVIFDEVQELRHDGSRKYSAASLLSSAADCVWGLSGTPIYGYGAEIWNVTNAIDFNCLGSFEAFSREWCTGYGVKVIEQPNVLGDYLRREGLMLRRRQSEVQPDLPPVLRRVQELDHDEELHAQLMREAIATARGFNELAWHRRGQAARDIDRRSRYAAGIAKAHQVGAFIVGLMEAGERPLVFAWHHDVHDVLREMLAPYHPAVLTGRETERQKDAALRSFVNDQAGVAILSLRTAAGIDGLQARATCVVMAELDWAPAVHGQCETRAARLGVPDTVTEIPSYYCVARTGYDVTMMDVLGLKTAQFQGIMGDEPETAEEKVAQDEAVARRLQTLIERLAGHEVQLRVNSGEIVQALEEEEE